MSDLALCCISTAHPGFSFSSISDCSPVCVCVCVRMCVYGGLSASSCSGTRGHRTVYVTAGLGSQRRGVRICSCILEGSVPATGMGLCALRAPHMPICKQDQRPITGWTVPKPSSWKDPHYIYTYIFQTNRPLSGSARERSRRRPLVLV